MSEERSGMEEKKDGNDEADELHGNVRKFNRWRIESETDTEESEDATESNERRGDKGKIQMIESDSEEDHTGGTGRSEYSSNEEEPISIPKDLLTKKTAREDRGEKKKKDAIEVVDLMLAEENVGASYDNIEELFEARKEELDTIAINSKYATYKFKDSAIKKKTITMNIENIVATDLQQGQNSMTDQDMYRKLVISKVNEFKTNVQSVSGIDSLIDEAMNKLDKKKKPVQSSILNFFGKKTDKVKAKPVLPVEAKPVFKVEIETKKVDDEEEKTTLSKLGDILNVSCHNFEVSATSNKLIGDFHISVEKFMQEKYLYDKCKNRTKEGSSFGGKVKVANEALENVKVLLNNGQKNFDQTERLASSKKSFLEKKRIYKNGQDVHEQVEREVMSLILSNKQEIVNATREIKKRNQTKEARKKFKKEETYKMVNGNLTWEEALNNLSSEPVNGVTISEDDALLIKSSIQESGSLPMRDILDILKRDEHEEAILKNLLVDRLPLCLMKNKEKGASQLIDCQEFLKDPSLMVDLYMKEPEFTSVKKTDKIIPVVRYKGSGRPKGSYKLRGTIVEEVKKFIEFAGLPAHERRREDVW